MDSRLRLEELEPRDLPALTIIPTFAANILSDPSSATIQATINQAIQNLEKLVADPITVNITFQEMSTGLGQSSWFYNTVSYSSYRAALVTHATSAADASALATLPNTASDPVTNSGNIRIQQANNMALGLGASSASGTISLNTSICNLDRTSINPAKYDLEAVAMHEIDEVLGFGSGLNGLNNGDAAPTTYIWGEDLYRYDQLGVRSYNTTQANQAYFSIDGGTTHLARYNQTGGGDFSDWYSFFGGVTPEVQDAYSTPGSTPDLGVAEIDKLDVIGYTIINTLVTVNSGNLTITDTALNGKNDGLTIQANSSLSEYIIKDPNAILGTFGIAGATTSADYHTVTVPFSVVTGTQVVVNTGAGDDSLTLDYSVGSFPQAVTYDGGTGSNSLTVTGGTFANETYTYTGSTGGAINLAGQTVTYANVASLADTTASANLAFTLPASVTATLQDDSITGNDVSQIAAAGIVPTTFKDPATLLTINAAGSSTIHLAAMDSAFHPAIEAFNGLTSDTFTLSTAGAISSQSSVNLATATLDLNGSSPIIDGLLGNGKITNNGAAAVLTIGASGGAGTFSGIIQDGAGGVALTKQGTGSETLSGANTYSGATTISAGKIIVGINNALPTGTTVADAGTLDLNGFNQQVAGITGAGAITSATSATLTVNNSSSDTFAGAIGGSVALTISGGGTLILQGTSNYSGATTVSAGTLEVDGQIASAVTVNSTATLAGTGQVGATTVNTGGTLSPGSSGPGLLTINGNLFLSSGATFAAQLSGTTAGSGGYDQVSVSGPTVALNNATLALTIGVGFTLPLNSTYQLINNTGAAAISGTFNGLLEGGTATAANGRQFSISYVATGNDVQIKEKAMTFVWDGKPDAGGLSADASWMTGSNWVGDAAPTEGDILQFGAAGAVQATNSNNFPVGTIFSSILFNASGYVLNGNALQLTGGITSSASGVNTINAALSLTASQSFLVTNNGGDLVLGNAVHLAGNTLTANLTGAIHANGSIDGTGTGSALSLQGSGTFVVGAASASTYAGATTVSGGTLQVDGSIASNVTVSGTATLTGVGSTGTVTNAGTQYLGAAVSKLTTGALNLQAGSNFNVRLTGGGTGQFSQDKVTSGTVTLSTTGAGVKLNLSTPVSYVPSGGETYTVIDNSANTAQPVTGTFLAGTGIDNFAPGTPLPEGAVLSTNFLGSLRIATLTYQAGPKHDSVAIVVSTLSPLVYNGTASINHFLLKQENDVVLGKVLKIYDKDTNNLLAFQAASQTSSVQISVASGLDATLTIDYSSPFTIPVLFNGGTGTAEAHTITLQNATYTNANFNETSASAGTIALDSENITYSNVNSISDATLETNISFNLPAGAQGSLQDTGTTSDGVSALVTSNNAFVPVSFTNPSASLTITGAGTDQVRLAAMDAGFAAGTETFAGLASDTFQFTNAAAIPAATSVTLTTATLDLSGLSPVINALNGSGIITNSVAAAAVLSVGSSGGTGSFRGAIQDGGATKTVGLTKLGGGTETLSGSNTYSGLTTITSGTLQAGAANALSANSDFADSATLDLKGFSQSIGALGGSGLVTSSASGAITFTIGANNDDATFSGTIQKGSATSFALVKSGGGTEIFNSTTNTYSAGTTIIAGILQIGDGSAFGNVGTGAVTIGANGTLRFDAPASSSASPNNFANNISGAGAISVISANNGNLGAVKVSGANASFTGSVNIAGGSYQLGSVASLGAPSAINVSGTGQFYFGAVTSLTVNAPIALSTLGYADGTGAIRFSGAGDLLAGQVTVTGNAMVSAFSGGTGTIQGNIVGAGSLQIGSGTSSETIILTGNDSANTTINASATLQVGNAGTVGALTGGTVTDNGSLVFKRSDTVSVGASIAGSGTLAQSGTGTLILPAANTYTYAGPTSVTLGLLQVDGAIASDVNVSGNGKLSGVGTIGALTGNSAGAIAPGDAPAVGTLTTDDLTLNASFAFNVGIAGSASYSQINVASGAISLSTLGAGVTLNLTTVGGYTPIGGDEYIIVANGGGSAIGGAFVAGAGIDDVVPGTPLGEGALLSEDFMGTGRAATITYLAGPNHDSVAIQVSNATQFKYNGGAGPHNFRLQEDVSQVNFELYDLTVSADTPVATQAIASTSSILINLAQNNDAALTVDYGNGQFTNKVRFDGGTGPGSSIAHTLTLSNGIFAAETFAYNSATAGSVQLDAQPILYTNVSNLADSATISVGAVSFNLPTAAQALFQDDGVAGNGLSKVVTQNSSFVPTTFADPGSLAILATGASTIQLAGMDSTFNPASESLSGMANDTFRLNSAAALHADTEVTLTAATLDLQAASPTIDALAGTGRITTSAGSATLTVGGNGGSGTFAGLITGNVSFAKSGAGIETLSTANTYTGATTINAGRIVLGIANALPTATALSVTGALELNGFDQQVGSVTGVGAVSNSSVTSDNFTVNNSGADTFAGTINGNLAFTKSAPGVLTLSNANTWTGSTTVSGGTLKQAAAGTVPDSTDLSVAGTLDLGGFSLQVASIAGAGTVTNSSTTAATFTIDDAADNAFDGAFAGKLALTKEGVGTLTLAKASSYTLATTITTGTIALAVTNALPTGTGLAVAGTLDLAGFAQQVASVTGAGTVTDSGSLAIFNINNSSTDTFAGLLSGALSLVKTAGGTLILTHANTYTGSTGISAGTLQLGNGGAIPAASDVLVGGTLDLNGLDATVGALSGAGTVRNNFAGPSTFTIGASDNSATFSGVIMNGTGVVAVTKTGAGVETFTSAMTYTGTTTIDGGVLTVNKSLYASSTIGVVALTGLGVTLNGTGIIRGQVSILQSSFAAQSHVDGVTITVPTAGVGIFVDPSAEAAQIGVTKKVTINGGNNTSVGVLVQGSAMIVGSNISGHHLDVEVDGGSAVLQQDTLNAGNFTGASGLQVENGGIVDAGQSNANATPLPVPPYAVGNVGIYGDITGLFSGTPLGSSSHSIGGNTFNNYTLSSASSNPTVPQAIRDLNTGAAAFGALPNSVETSFTYGGTFQLGRMDLPAQNNIFNGSAKQTTLTLTRLIFDGQRDSTRGFVAYSLPQLQLSLTGTPSYVGPGAAYATTVNYANLSDVPTFAVLSMYVPSNVAVDLGVNPGWVNRGSGLYTYDLGVLAAGATGTIQFNASVILKPTSTKLTTTAVLGVDLTSPVSTAKVTVTTTVNPNNVRWHS